MFSCYSRFLYYNTRPNPLVRWEEGSTAKEHVGRLPLNRLETLEIIPPKSASRCITSWNKPSIQPSYPTCQVALILTSRIATMTKNTQRRVYTNSLEISWNLTVPLEIDELHSAHSEIKHAWTTFRGTSYFTRLL